MAADHRDGPAVTFELATSEDPEALRLAATRAFEADINYGAPAVGGPPGYNTVAWHQSLMRQATEYYKIVADHRVVGGFTVFAMGCDLCVLGTIYIVPEFQNQGSGRRAIEFLWGQYPDARCWTLETPGWNKRNHHFYESLGLRRVEVRAPGSEDESFVYEKHMRARHHNRGRVRWPCSRGHKAGQDTGGRRTTAARRILQAPRTHCGQAIPAHGVGRRRRSAWRPKPRMRDVPQAQDRPIAEGGRLWPAERYVIRCMGSSPLTTQSAGSSTRGHFSVCGASTNSRSPGSSTRARRIRASSIPSVCTTSPAACAIILASRAMIDAGWLRLLCFMTSGTGRSAM